MRKNKKRQGKYGFVEFIDKRKLKDGLTEYDVEPEIRKPTPKEREDIILNFIRAYSGRSVRVWGLAEKLGVSDRTIQKILKKFEEEGLVKRTPVFTKTGKQKGNILTYIGEDKEVDYTLSTFNTLYNPENPYGFRDWDWEHFKFTPGVFDDGFTKHDSMEQYEYLCYLRKNNADKREEYLKSLDKNTPSE